MNVTILPVCRQDAPEIERYAADPLIAATCNVPHPYPVGGGLNFVTAALESAAVGTQLVFAIKRGGEFAGLMTLNQIQRAEKSADLDYWVAVPHWGQGVATAAARLAITQAFQKLGLTVLRSGCLKRNEASACVLVKNGFRFVGEGLIQSGRFAGESFLRFELRAG